MRQILKNQYSGAMLRSLVRPQCGPCKEFNSELLSNIKSLEKIFSGLKILGYDNIGRAGSIPARGTNPKNIKHLAQKSTCFNSVLSNSIYAKIRNRAQWCETTMRPNSKCVKLKHSADLTSLSSAHSFKKLNHHIKTTSRGGSGEGFYGEAFYRHRQMGRRLVFGSSAAR